MEKKLVHLDAVLMSRLKTLAFNLKKPSSVIIREALEKYITDTEIEITKNIKGGY